MTLQALILRYSCFAAVSTVANLATQRLVLMFGTTGLMFPLAVAAGTLVGLVIKFVLDKRWIFADFSTGLKSTGRKFTLYTGLGLITTAIFWGSETAFWYIWHTEFMRELGAVIGLSIGYVVKYNLDRHFVFTDSQLRPAP